MDAYSQPIPAEPMAVLPLTYSVRHSEPLPPWIRIGGLFGLVGILLNGLMVPIWTKDWSLTDIRGNATSDYMQIAVVLCPFLQFFCFGAGIALILAGKAIGRVTLGRRGLRVALILNLFTLFFAVHQVTSLLRESRLHQFID